MNPAIRLLLLSKTPTIPPDIGNLVGWWDAASIAGLANDDPCGTWSDRSGLGNHVTQAGAASLKPTYKTGVQNSLPGVYFDGGDYLFNHAIAAYFSGDDKPLSVVLALKITNGASPYPLMCGNAATNALFGCGYNSDIIKCAKVDDSAATKVAEAAYTYNNTAHIAAYKHTTVASAWASGAAKFVDQAADAGATTLDTFCLGAGLIPTMSVNITGHLFSVLLYRSALSDADRVLIQNYQSAKWGIALS